MSILLARPEVEGVFGLMEEFAEEVAGPTRSIRAPATNRHPCCMIVRRSLLERVGPFDETLELASAPAWVALAQSRDARLVGIDEVVLFRRLHDANMGLSRWQHRAEYARAMHSGLVARAGESPGRATRESAEAPGVLLGQARLKEHPEAALLPAGEAAPTLGAWLPTLRPRHLDWETTLVLPMVYRNLGVDRLLSESNRVVFRGLYRSHLVWEPEALS